MKDRFKENDYRLGFDFVTEESLNDAIQRAMFAWSSNHKYVTFFNVTDKCNLENKGSDCSVAELYIQATMGAEEYDWAPVHVTREYGSDNVRSTADKGIAGKPIRRSVITFFLDHPVELPDFPRGLQCYYLDTTFCEPFQNAQQFYNVKLLIEVVTFFLWAIAFVLALFRVAEYVVTYYNKGARKALVP